MVLKLRLDDKEYRRREFFFFVFSAIGLFGITVKATDSNPYLGSVWITDFIQLEEGGTKYYIGDEVDLGTGSPI